MKKKKRFYCLNSDCPVTELSRGKFWENDNCPCCGSTVVDADEHDDEIRHELDQANCEVEYDRRMYGDLDEDERIENGSNQLFTNDEGEPIGWGKP